MKPLSQWLWGSWRHEKRLHWLWETHDNQNWQLELACCPLPGVLGEMGNTWLVGQVDSEWQEFCPKKNDKQCAACICTIGVQKRKSLVFSSSVKLSVTKLVCHVFLKNEHSRWVSPTKSRRVRKKTFSLWGMSVRIRCNWFSIIRCLRFRQTWGCQCVGGKFLRKQLQHIRGPILESLRGRFLVSLQIYALLQEGEDFTWSKTHSKKFEVHFA